jgi:hypothetical protein
MSQADAAHTRRLTALGDFATVQDHSDIVLIERASAMTRRLPIGAGRRLVEFNGA